MYRSMCVLYFCGTLILPELKYLFVPEHNHHSHIITHIYIYSPLAQPKKVYISFSPHTNTITHLVPRTSKTHALFDRCSAYDSRRRFDKSTIRKCISFSKIDHHNNTMKLSHIFMSYAACKICSTSKYDTARLCYLIWEALDGSVCSECLCILWLWFTTTTIWLFIILHDNIIYVYIIPEYFAHNQTSHMTRHILRQETNKRIYVFRFRPSPRYSASDALICRRVETMPFDDIDSWELFAIEGTHPFRHIHIHILSYRRAPSLSLFRTHLYKS